MTDPESIKRFPLEWPIGWVRTPAHKRRHATFSTKKTANRWLTVQIATGRLEAELDRLGARQAVLSTNVSLRLDGRPRSDENPKDPGAAIYFAFRGKATVLACDRYSMVADNIAAIAAHIDALRRIERYGVGTIEQALAGYKALPADTAANWRAVLRGQVLDQAVPQAVRHVRRPTGDFLKAVLSNDLKDAAQRADAVSAIYLVTLVRFLNQCAPAPAWGSREAVTAWLADPSPVPEIFE